MSEIRSIPPHELAELSQRDRVHLVDVRTPFEFQEVRATIALNIPLDVLDPHSVMNQRNGSADAPLYLICRSGARAAKACQQFIEAGYTNVVNVQGGTLAWDAAALPVVRGKKVIALDRQVRIVAGLLVLVSAVLAMFVHPYFAGVAAFVGAGVMCAGLTDWCGMGLLLAKMPWNRVNGEDASACNRRAS